MHCMIKFINSEKAKKIWRILLTYLDVTKYVITNKIWRFRQILVAFLEYTIFINGSKGDTPTSPRKYSFCNKWACFSQNYCDNYVPQWWVEFNGELSWLFTNRLRTFYPKCLQKILLKIFVIPILLTFMFVSGSPESVNKQATQLIIKFKSSLRHIIVTNVTP